MGSCGDSLFATVCFIQRDGSKEATLRVPVEDPTITTVRRLAKDAMRRLVAVLRRKQALHLTKVTPNTFGGSKKPANGLPFTGVSRIFVGEELSSQVDIFGRDLVCNVVRLREEVIYMRLCYNSTATKTTNNKNGNSSSDVKNARDGGKAMDALIGMQSSTNMSFFSYSEDSSAARASPSFSPPLQQSLSSTSRDGVGADLELFSEMNSSSAFPCGEPTSTTLVDVENFNKTPAPENALDGFNIKVGARGGGFYPPTELKENALQNEASFEKNSFEGGNRSHGRNIQGSPQEHGKPPSKANSEEGKEGESDKALVCPRISDEDLERDARRLRENTRSRPLGWGPEAHWHFATNYVSTPQKLMRKVSKTVGKRPREMAKVANNRSDNKVNKPAEGLIGLTNAACTPRGKDHALEYTGEGCVEAHSRAPTTTITSDIEKKDPANSAYKTPKTVAKRVSGASHATSSPSSVSRQLVFDCDKEEKREREAEIPSGWGSEATKYFDPSTYCDNPAKAHLSTEPRTQRIQARRQIELPAYLAYLDY